MTVLGMLHVGCIRSIWAPTPLPAAMVWPVSEGGIQCPEMLGPRPGFFFAADTDATDPERLPGDRGQSQQIFQDSFRAFAPGYARLRCFFVPGTQPRRARANRPRSTVFPFPSSRSS